MNDLMSRSSFPTPSRDDLFAPFEEVFNNFFDDFWPSFQKNVPSIIKKGSSYPKMDALVDGTDFKVQVACPGVKKEDLKIEIIPENGKVWLSISGKMAENYEYKDKIYICRELSKGMFKRSMTLPEGLEGDPTADLKDGMLTLTWKMTPVPEKATKRITVN